MVLFMVAKSYFFQSHSGLATTCGWLRKHHVRHGLKMECWLLIIPIASMYGIFTYMYHRNQPNVGKYTIHGSYGIYCKLVLLHQLNFEYMDVSANCRSAWVKTLQ